MARLERRGLDGAEEPGDACVRRGRRRFRKAEESAALERAINLELEGRLGGFVKLRIAGVDAPLERGDGGVAFGEGAVPRAHAAPERVAAAEPRSGEAEVRERRDVALRDADGAPVEDGQGGASHGAVGGDARPVAVPAAPEEARHEIAPARRGERAPGRVVVARVKRGAPAAVIEPVVRLDARPGPPHGREAGRASRGAARAVESVEVAWTEVARDDRRRADRRAVLARVAVHALPAQAARRAVARDDGAEAQPRGRIREDLAQVRARLVDVVEQERPRRFGGVRAVSAAAAADRGHGYDQPKRSRAAHAQF